MTPIGALVNGASGVLLIGLGIFVLSVRPRTPQNKALAIFLVAYGARFVLVNAAGFSGPYNSAVDFALLLVASVAGLVATASMITVALLFPRPLAPAARRRALGLPVAVAVTVAVVNAWIVIADFPDLMAYARALGYAESALVMGGVELTSSMTSVIAQVLFVDVLARRYPTLPRADQRSAVFLAAALTLYPGFVMGTLLTIPLDAFKAMFLVLMVITPLNASFWLFATTQAAATARVAARNMAWIFLGAFLSGMILAVVFGQSASTTSVLPGVFRTLGALVLTYSILRHQLLGVDVKARWTISKSTIAAIFIAVFFIASETAQEFFGDTLGSTYVGIAAAGALVFAMAPLQRVAERLAEKAVPIARAVDVPEPVSRTHDETFYRNAVRLALRTEHMTQAEEIHLAALGERLGLTASRARAIEIEERNRDRDATVTEGRRVV